MIQKGNNVLLKNMGSRLALSSLSVFLDYAIDFFKGFNYNDTVASVGVFPWLDEPSVSSFWFKSVLNLVVRIVLLALFLLFDLLVSLIIFL